MSWRAEWGPKRVSWPRMERDLEREKREAFETSIGVAYLLAKAPIERLTVGEPRSPASSQIGLGQRKLTWRYAHGVERLEQVAGSIRNHLRQEEPAAAAKFVESLIENFNLDPNKIREEVLGHWFASGLKQSLDQPGRHSCHSFRSHNFGYWLCDLVCGTPQVEHDSSGRAAIIGSGFGCFRWRAVCLRKFECAIIGLIYIGFGWGLYGFTGHKIKTKPVI